MSDPVVLTANASKLARKGHPWFYADDLMAGDVPPIALVRVNDETGRDLGLGFHSAPSKLRLRLCGGWPGTGVPDPEQFFAERLSASVARRSGLVGSRGACRVVHAEADGLPGLVIDRYGEGHVLQSTSWVVEQHLDSIVPWLAAQGSSFVIARNDVAARRFEKLPEETRLLHGQRVETVTVEEEGLLFTVRLWTGHKTGLYLDQRPARRRVGQLASGRSVLDLFAYQGGFSLAALKGGARSVLAVDQSRGALDQADADAEANGLSGLETLAENAFGVTRSLRSEGRQFDLVVLDPPAFCKNRRELAGGLRGYRDLNRTAVRLLAEGGYLLTCSCSHHLTLPMFEDVLRQAAADLPFRLVLRERLMAGPDHPVWVSLPESEYLKVLLLQRT